MAITLNHTGFVVKDIEKSIFFYTNALGLHLDREAESSTPGLAQCVGYKEAHIKAALLTGADGHTLELIQYINPAGVPREESAQYPRNLHGATHLAFIVDDIEEVFQRLLDNGAQKLNGPAIMRPELKACYLQDPDGNWIELMEDKVHKKSPFHIKQNTAALDWSSRD